jgi:hypothetical protein
MKIEPCAYCGGKMFSMRTGACYCSSCSTIVENCDIEKHNHLSRIVRAAGQWAKAVRFEEEATSGKRCVPIKTQLDAQDWVTEAEDALLEAVEGGAE